MTKSRFVVYEEVTGFPTWANVLLWMSVGAASVPSLLEIRRLLEAGMPFPMGLFLAVTVPLLFAFAIIGLFGKLTTQVRRTSIRVAFGYLPLIEKIIPFEEIHDTEVVRYRPLREFGGWGIRGGWGGGKSAWTLRGDQALVLKLHDGHQLYLGSEYPERLQTSLRGVWKAESREETPS